MKLIKLIGWFDARTFWSQKSAFGNSNRLSPELLRSSSCSFTEWLQQMHQLDVCAFIKTFTATTPPSSFPLSQFHQPTFTFTNPLAQVRRGTCLSTVNSNLIHCLVFSFTIVNHPPILWYNFGCVVKNMNMEFLCFCLSSFCNKTICGTSCSWLAGTTFWSWDASATVTFSQSTLFNFSLFCCEPSNIPLLHKYI